ncbi:MAG: hypothetical protein WAW92_00235 [Minisyncoccia bacterium]
MLYSKSKSLEELVTEQLLSSPLSIKKVHGNLKDKHKSVSLRAVYKVVNLLIKAGVLIKSGRVVRIDEEWVRGLRSKIASSVISPISPGERISYSFVSIAHLDAFWKTITLQLEDYEKDGQIFFYNPHNFWAYLPERRESEDAYYNHFNKSKLHAFFTVGGVTTADKEFKRRYKNKYLQINTNSVVSLGRQDHITILGDHIISVRMGEDTSRLIDDAYKTEKPISELLPELLVILQNSVKIRFTLENNQSKARKLKKILSRDFYFGSKVSN